ncbi:MAG: HD domain-containing protein [Candidatus Nanoarchaeia archaeon]
MMGSKELVDFFFEAGFLKSVPRSGWFFLGKNNPESVAEHSFRTALIGYVIAKKEGADADLVMKICLFHDFHETRLGDFNMVNKRYMEPGEAEKKSFSEALDPLDEEIKSELIKLHSDFEGDSFEAMIAKDADFLECAVQAKEYFDQGSEMAWGWIKNAESKLKTNTAKEIFESLLSSSSFKWWEDLKKTD